MYTVALAFRYCVKLFNPIRLFLLCLFLVLPVFARGEAQPQRQTFRVGYVEEPAYSFKDAQGEYQGYTIELLYSIASHGNLALQFVEFPDYEQEDRALLDGNIDVEVVVPYSETREQQFLVSETATLNVPLTLLVRDDDERYEFGDIKAVNNMRIGVVKNDATVEAFLAWSRKNKLQPQLIYFTDYKIQLNALKAGEVDAITNGNELTEGCRRFLYYAHIPCYAIFNKQRNDLKQIFDMALRQTLAANPLLEEQLHNEYLLNNIVNLDLITQTEKAFLAEHREVTVAVPAFDPPYVWGDKAALQGILADYYALLGKETGMHFTLQTYPTAAAALAAVQQGQAQVLGIFSGTQADAYKNGLRFIDMSGKRSLVRIDKYGYAGKKVAVTTRNLLFLQQRLAGQDYEFLPCRDNEVCYQALKSGKVDSILCTDTAATWIFNHHRTEGYSMVPLTLTKKIYFAVPVTADTALYTLLSKGALKMAQQYSSIVIANVSPQASFSNILARLPFWGLATFAGVMAALTILLIVLIVLLVRRYREKAQLASVAAENEKEKIRLEALEKNAEEKNQFFANISHDLRTPLNAIMGFSELALQADLPAKRVNYLKKIILAGQLMLDLVNDTLTMSKLKSGKLELKLEPLPQEVLQLFQPVFDSVREAATAKHITLEVTSAEARRRKVLGDKLNLQKILLNLLTNAIKYTPEGGHVKVRFWNETAADGGLDSLLSVQDDGIGIAPEFQAQIFEPFYQEKRPGYESSGTGLGLTIVQQLVVLMGGNITLFSSKDQGSLFTVRIRLKVAPEKLVVQEQKEQPAEKVKLDGRCILLCEDNALNREITCALLKSRGITVVNAENGRQGVELFTKNKPGTFAAVLMDVRMPVMDGYEATRQLRSLARPDAQQIPIIALSAETFAEDIEKCLKSGMNAHVAKPLVPKLLFATLAKYIR